MMTTSTAALAPKLMLPLWHDQLQAWGQTGRSFAAAQEDLMLQGTPMCLQNLIDQWAAGDFQGIPPIVLLSLADMNGGFGAYAESTGTIYLNDEWAGTASQEGVSAVLTAELASHSISNTLTSDAPQFQKVLLSQPSCSTI